MNDEIGKLNQKIKDLESQVFELNDKINELKLKNKSKK